MKTHGRSVRAGFTVMELIVSVALVAILLGTIGLIYNVALKTFYSQWARSGIKGQCGRALAQMSADLRQADSLTSAGNTSLTLTADTNSDGIEETVQYAWSGVSGAPLNRSVVSPAPAVTVSVVSAIGNLLFSYYDSHDNLLPLPVTLSQVKCVAANITAIDGDETFRLQSRATLRIL